MQEILSEAGAAVLPIEPIETDAGTAVAVELPQGGVDTGKQLIDVGLCGTFEISQDVVREWIDVPFDAAAEGFGKPDLKLNKLERALFVPAVTGCLNKYLPDFLKDKTSPELWFLTGAITVYGIRIGAGPALLRLKAQFEKSHQAAQAQPKASSSDRGAQTAGLRASTPTSGSPAPEKRSALVPTFDV